MIFQEPLNWFYTDMPVRMPGEADRYAYQLVPGQDPRPGNFEDELVNDFIALTNQPEWVGDNVEGNLRIALRRAADAAVRTTLDAEKTAEERKAHTAPVADANLETPLAALSGFVFQAGLVANRLAENSPQSSALHDAASALVTHSASATAALDEYLAVQS